MNKEEYFYLGKIIKPIGNKGHLAVLLDVDDPSRYEKLETVFVSVDQDKIPYTVASLEITKANRIILKFEDVDTPEDASPFSGRALYLPMSLLPPLKGKRFYHHEITGFTVIDVKHGNIGTVTAVLDMPGHPLLQVRHGEKEILVPLVEDVIRKVDRRKKAISIQAPEGLIDIYL